LPVPAPDADAQHFRDWFILAAALLASFSLGAWLMHRLRLWRDQRLARARNARGRRGEARAAELLLAAGYEILARQQRTSYALRAGDDERRVGLSFDFVVSRDGQRCVAEVKTGALVTQLKHAETRRQLLEYQLASGATQVLLVDPERDRITVVAFPLGDLKRTALPAANVAQADDHAVPSAIAAFDQAAEPRASAQLLWILLTCAGSLYLFARYLR